MGSLSLLMGGVFIAFCCSVDLELGKVDEDLFQVGAHKREVLDDTALLHLGQLGEGLAQEHVAALDVDAFDTVADLNRFLH